MNNHLFPYKWYLRDGYPSKNIKPNKYNVFGTFICGGGSTMGYKLAGYNHLGGVEIDTSIADVYKTNHKPKYLYNMDIREFNNIIDLPSELYNLDILDGSPPCSTFSMAGSREKAWGKEKYFKEGQAKQILDDLVFVYCDTIIKLQPKIFLLENVKGIIQGNAKVYSKNIVKKMTHAGYNVQVFCLNAASMGVPQRRERIFFIGHKKEYSLPKLKLNFSEIGITFGEIYDEKENKGFLNPTSITYKRWLNRTISDKNFGQISKRMNGIESDFNTCIIHDTDVAPTMTTKQTDVLYTKPRHLSSKECSQIGTFPLDYNFKSIEPKYLIGMSVPPVMTAQIANQIKIQWLDKTAEKQPK